MVNKPSKLSLLIGGSGLLGLLGSLGVSGTALLRNSGLGNNISAPASTTVTLASTTKEEEKLQITSEDSEKEETEEIGERIDFCKYWKGTGQWDNQRIDNFCS